ncbi:hypothetical protein C2E23DRAFT_800618 [Lenzites betulinus]|nr:hypothetical protein C2E23DRAFT_800618 [Lenzites betulinus]
MAPKRAPCQVCQAMESKYTCAKCAVVYCSVPCYKTHQETCIKQQPSVASSSRGAVTSLSSERELPPTANSDSIGGGCLREVASGSVDGLEESAPLRALSSLNWPYVPEESAFPDPLKRDDPKPLQLPQYEAVATSPAIRRVIASNPRLREILQSIDVLRGEDREIALHEALGIGEARGRILTGRESEEDRTALRELAEAVEAAVRGGKQGMLGLDWGD